MKIWGLNKPGLDMALLLTNVRYGDNVKFAREPQYKRTHWIISLKTEDAMKVGSRRSKKKISNSACWHVHRDFYENIFKINPLARVSTFTADYKGEGAFRHKFTATGEKDLGNGLLMKDACNCVDF